MVEVETSNALADGDWNGTERRNGIDRRAGVDRRGNRRTTWQRRSGQDRRGHKLYARSSYAAAD
jgi:hypothetical protein